jgi:hypothetical protein
MLLIALLLGLTFAWLVELLWTQYCAYTRGRSLPAAGRRARRRRGRRREAALARLRRGVLNAFLVFVFFGVAIIYALGLYGRFFGGDWSSPFVIALHYMTAPSVLGGLAAFVLGALCMWYRGWLAALVEWLRVNFFERPPAPPAGQQPPPAAQPGALAGAQAGQAAQPTAEAQAARQPYPWLTSIVGIAAVTLVAVVTLVIFFPEILGRVESIKVAGVEARFATAATRTIQLASQNDETMRTDQAIQSWATLLEPSIAAAQARVSGQDPNLTGVEGHNFARDFAMPFSRAVSCYARDFRVRDTKLQDDAARAANEWRHALKKKGNDLDPDSRLDKAVRSTRELFQRIQDDLGVRKSACYDPKNAIAFDVTRQNLPHLRKSGFFVSFVAQFLLLTHEPSQAEALIGDVSTDLDTTPATLIAQVHFYSNRSEIRFITRSPAADIDHDLNQVQLLTDRLMVCLRDTKANGCRDFNRSTPQPAHPAETNIDKIIEYFDLLRVGTINNRLDVLIKDWLGGARLRPAELLRLEGSVKEGLAYDLSDWLSRRPLSALRDRKQEGVAKHSILATAAIHDTLAMREIAIGASKNDFSRDRCARIPPHLATARRIYEEFELKDDLRIVSQHYNLYETVCVP